MNVASLELCKELFELSGWETGKWLGYWTHNQPNQEGRVEPVGEAPAYDLGYLLRKLSFDYVSLEYKEDNNYYRWSWVASRYALKLGAETPEDAACKLAIELFKQGILTNQFDNDQRTQDKMIETH